jgi:hypothetical protein
MRGNPHPPEHKIDTPQQGSRQQNQMVSQVKPPDHVSEPSRSVLPLLQETLAVHAQAKRVTREAAEAEVATSTV